MSFTRTSFVRSNPIYLSASEKITSICSNIFVIEI